jgi:hypothetical protein
MPEKGLRFGFGTVAEPVADGGADAVAPAEISLLLAVIGFCPKPTVTAEGGLAEAAAPRGAVGLLPIPAAGEGAMADFNPGSVPDAARFGSGEIAKRPRASPSGIVVFGSGGAGMGVSERRLTWPVALVGTGGTSGSNFGCGARFAGGSGLLASLGTGAA